MIGVYILKTVPAIVEDVVRLRQYFSRIAISHGLIDFKVKGTIVII